MQTNKITEIASPSVRRIQSKMTEVIEHFKSKGYIPSNSKLERTPDADYFEVVEKVTQKPSGACDVIVYRSKEQDMTSFRQNKNSEVFSMEKVDKDENGHVVRKVCDYSNPKAEWKELQEYEYNANEVVKETKFSTFRHYTSKEVKTINPETGYYTIEKSYPDLKMSARNIEHFNNEGKKIMETYIDENITRKIQINPSNGQPMAIVEEYLEESSLSPCKIVEKCLLDNSGRVAKYEQTVGGEYLMFERNCQGKITHYIDVSGTEFRYNPGTGMAIITTKTGETYMGSQIDAINFVSLVQRGISPVIGKYL